jgi:hypothetical protein
MLESNPQLMPNLNASLTRCLHRSQSDPEIPDAETPDPGQIIGIPDFPNPGIPAKPGFPISRIPGSRQTGIQIRENPDFFAATRTVIASAHC